VVFDKTGTLTTGPTVTDCLPVCPLTPDALPQLAAAAESGTCHPLAAAIGQSAQRQGCLSQLRWNFTRNRGWEYLLWKASVLLGNCDWLPAPNFISERTENAKTLALDGKTVVYGVGRLAGLIAVTIPLDLMLKRR